MGQSIPREGQSIHVLRWYCFNYDFMPCLKLLEYLDIILMMYGNLKNTDLLILIVVRYSSGKVSWYAIDFSRQVDVVICL